MPDVQEVCNIVQNLIHVAGNWDMPVWYKGTDH